MTRLGDLEIFVKNVVNAKPVRANASKTPKTPVMKLREYCEKYCILEKALGCTSRELPAVSASTDMKDEVGRVNFSGSTNVLLSAGIGCLRLSYHRSASHNELKVL